MKRQSLYKNSYPEVEHEVCEAADGKTGATAGDFAVFPLPRDFCNSGDAADDADSLKLRRVTGLSASVSAAFSLCGFLGMLHQRNS